MKITKSQLKRIIKEELDFVINEVDTDEDGIPDKKELNVIDRGELAPTLDEVITQLFDLRKQHKAKEQWEVARYIDEAIDRLEHAQSLAKTLNEMLGGDNYPGASGPSSAHMTVPEIERIVAAAGIDGLMYGHAVDLMKELDRANIDRRGFEDMLQGLPHHTKTTGRPYGALKWIYDQIG